MNVKVFLGNRWVIYKNATVIRNPEYPNWVDVVSEDTADNRTTAHIFAMVPAGMLIEFERL